MGFNTLLIKNILFFVSAVVIREVPATRIIN